jgi:hypothetical protein
MQSIQDMFKQLIADAYEKAGSYASLLALFEDPEIMDDFPKLMNEFRLIGADEMATIASLRELVDELNGIRARDYSSIVEKLEFCLNEAQRHLETITHITANFDRAFIDEYRETLKGNMADEMRHADMLSKLMTAIFNPEPEEPAEPEYAEPVEADDEPYDEEDFDDIEEGVKAPNLREGVDALISGKTPREVFLHTKEAE